MSAANKCDRCGVLYEEDEKGALVLDVAVQTGDDKGTYDNWTDVDLCPPCGREVLKIIGVAMNDLDPKLLR